MILSADYSQIEVKLMAYLSGDPGLIADINQGGDIHSRIATKVFGKKLGFTYDDINAARKDHSHPRHFELSTIRSNIKTVTFGVPYGAGKQRVALMTGLTEDEAQVLIDEYFAEYPVLKLWLEQQGRLAVQYGYSTSPRGRKRFYELPSPDDKDADGILSQIRRWAGNHPIQAGNVDMLKPALAEIYQELRERGISPEDARVLFVVHDEIVMTARLELVDTVKDIMVRHMEASYSTLINNIINQIDVAVAEVWAKA